MHVLSKDFSWLTSPYKMSCLLLRLLSNPAMLSHFVQAVWEKFDHSLSGSIRFIQRKLILIDSNLRRHCLIRRRLPWKCTFRWREFPRCPMDHKAISWLPWKGNVRQTGALAESSHGCSPAAGASPSGSAQHCWAGGDPIGNHDFSSPWEDHKATTCGILSYQHLLAFSSDADIILHTALEMRLICWEHQHEGKKLWSHWDTFQSAFAASEVWISTHGTIKT